MPPDPRIVAQHYFQVPAGYFWRWAEQGEVAEWHNGTTICYRAELEEVLRDLAPGGLPPLGAVLLVLAACNEGWSYDTKATLLDLRLQVPYEADDNWNLRRAAALLDVVAQLPRELRTGPAKRHLLRELMADPDLLWDDPDQVVVFVNEWTSGRLEVLLESAPAAAPDELLFLLRQDLPPLVALWNRVAAGHPDEAPQRLTQLLQTGLTELPPELPTPLPEPATPDAPASADLWEQLSQDTRTAGLARLTQRLVAALRIPLHTHEASELPLGGVADVTNRGPLDRLLLSELAHDEPILLARLANNEALYLRREAPPRPQPRPHVILLDTTLRLWGVPRIFALAAALAWARQTQQPRPGAPVRALALGGQAAAPLDLGSFDGVLAALSQLDAAPHAGAALRAYAATPEALAADALLITEAEVLRQPAFAAALIEARPALRYLLTVERTGELQLFEFQPGGHRARLGTSRHDLDALLFAPPPPRPRLPGRPGEGPLFWQQEPVPLFLPTTGVRPSAKTIFAYRSVARVLGISETQRVLYWPGKTTGAVELLPRIEAGRYYFGADADTRHCYVLVRATGLLRVYLLDAQERTAESVDLNHHLAAADEPVQVAFVHSCFHVRHAGGTLVFDCLQREVAAREAGAFPSWVGTAFYPDLGLIKRHINNGYSALQRVRSLGVNHNDRLVLDGRELHLAAWTAQLHLKTVDPAQQPAKPAPLKAEPLPDRTRTEANPHNELLSYHHFEWADGSTAVVDSRGLLHLRSADAGLPEITLLLVIGRPLAAWAADGTVCGPDYFTGPAPAQRIPAADFYQRYLQPYLARLI
jgi:hypothetical protein